MDKFEKTHQEFKNAYYKVKIEPEDVDYKIANNYIPFLNHLGSIRAGLVVVVDYFKDNFFFVSNNAYATLGFNEKTIFSNNLVELRKRVHPEDFVINIAAVKAREFILSQPVKKRKDYKLSQELRMINDKKEWFRIIIQANIIELDAKGNLWLTIFCCDLSPVQDLSLPGRAALWDTKTGEIIFSMEGQKISSFPLSSREIEILGLVAKGMRSKEIADKLFISINTVNNHRKKLLEKMKVSNSSEAVKLAAKLGVI